MTQKIYRPSPSGGELQLKVGSDWKPIYGLGGITISGGDRETTTFETLDAGVESSVGGAGVKDINLTLNPSFFGAFYNKIIQDAYFGSDQITVRYRTLAQKNNIAVGATGHGIALAKIDAGYGNEGALTFEKTDGISKTALDAIKETAELCLLMKASDAAVGTSDRTEAEPAAGLAVIVRYDGSKVQASDWGGKAVAMKAATEGWALIRHGIAFEYTCRVTTAGNPDMSPGSPIGDTLTLQQVASGFKKYPILKAA